MTPTPIELVVRRMRDEDLRAMQFAWEGAENAQRVAEDFEEVRAGVLEASFVDVAIAAGKERIRRQQQLLAAAGGEVST